MLNNIFHIKISLYVKSLNASNFIVRIQEVVIMCQWTHGD